MPTLHQFGGNWTEEKLRRLEKYLSAYMRIFTSNPYAARFTTYYVDAFAGTGNRVEVGSTEPSTLTLFDDNDARDVMHFYQGSARIALDIQPSFDHFVFVERNPAHVQELRNLQVEYPEQSIQVYEQDANDFLQHWCANMDWASSRVVVFLDPYGMSVNWSTVEAIAATKAIDLWVLLPVGQAINRLLTRRGIPEKSWADKLTSFFGTDTWREAFYQPSMQRGLFDDEIYDKVATFESIGEYFANRLGAEFAKVADHSLVLMNSRNNPIYFLFFAAANPRGAETAVKIASDILGR